MFFIQIFLQVSWLMADAFQGMTQKFDWDKYIQDAVQSTQNTLDSFRSHAGQTLDDFLSNPQNYLRDFTAENFPDLGSKLSPITTTLTDWKISISQKLEQILSNYSAGYINDLAQKSRIFLEDKLSRTQEVLSQWKTHLDQALNPLLSNPQPTLDHFVREISNFLEPKLEQIKSLISDFWQSASQGILENLGNPNNWNGETIGRAVENVFSSITKSIFFIVEQSIKGIWQGVSASVHDIWGIIALLVIGLFIIMILRWQFVR
ncbi:hypothetical protein [Gloeothece verrucosa]|uniref:Uncharacterized protein n=1 Tax=Gloeothece verrucosa (strain PCC 7822) TaxID=497965 RepID=E0UAY4_GLOV7|nr:hypothetical protein [Gloeothece verrucosa]ADN15106.1 hypothetical protein Cyan7822_3152 [Gloeothece verrucosa PCC 7822]